MSLSRSIDFIDVVYGDFSTSHQIQIDRQLSARGEKAFMLLTLGNKITGI
jgi:hypothetical protein